MFGTPEQVEIRRVEKAFAKKTRIERKQKKRGGGGRDFPSPIRKRASRRPHDGQSR